MAETRKGSLKSLDGIYRFPGGLRAPGEVDIEAPVQIVHDVSRGAGALAGAYLTHEQTIVTDGGGTIERNTIDRKSLYDLPAFEAAVRNTGLNPGNSDVWVVRVEVQVDQNVSELSVMGVGFQDWPNPGSRFRLLSFPTVAWTTSGTALTASDGSAVKFGSTGTAPRQTVPLPVRVGAISTVAQDANNLLAVTIEVVWRIAIMPLGIAPLPGA